MYSMNRWGCHGGQPGIGVSRLIGIDFGVWNTFWWPWLCLDGLSSQTQGGSGWCCWLALIVGTSRRMYPSTSITAHLLFRVLSNSIPMLEMLITGSVDSLPSNWLKECQGVHCIISSLTCCQGQRNICILLASRPWAVLVGSTHASEEHCYGGGNSSYLRTID